MMKSVDLPGGDAEAKVGRARYHHSTPDKREEHV